LRVFSESGAGFNATGLRNLFRDGSGKMARLVIDRAPEQRLPNPWPRWEEMLGVGAAAGLHGNAEGGCAHGECDAVSTTAPAF
jgi:hypothetical protein